MGCGGRAIWSNIALLFEMWVEVSRGGWAAAQKDVGND